jgi:hypothetical protein
VDFFRKAKIAEILHRTVYTTTGYYTIDDIVNLIADGLGETTNGSRTGKPQLSDVDGVKRYDIDEVVSMIMKAHILIPIDDFFVEGKHITKNEYGKVLLKHLCIELKEKY